MPVKVTEEVLNGIKAVRDSGATNMLDHPRVVELLEELGHDQAATWVAENRSLYSKGIFQGFDAA